MEGHLMPQAAINALAAWLVSAGVNAAIAAFIAKVFVYAAANYLINRAINSKAPKHRGAGLGSGTEINYYDSGASIRIVYGQVRTGGMETIPPLISGQDSAFLHKVITFAGHEIDSYNYVHFDTSTITNAQINAMAFTNSDGMVNTGFYANNAWIRRYRGTSTDSADRMLMGVDSAAFNNSRGRGFAKLAVSLKFHADVYRSVPAITATYQGKRCYDPRLDAAPGASPTNPSYIQWTRNPALCLADYLMATFGGEYPSTDIDWDTVVTAANYCDTLVNIPGAATQARYTCNGVLFATEHFEPNMRAIVDCMLGRIIFRDGKWRMYAGSWQTPSFTIQKSDWVEGGLSIKFEQGRSHRINRMRCWFVDPFRDWQRVESMPRSNATYQTADGNETIDAETEQLMCTNEYEAQRKTEFLLRQSRNQIVVSGRLPPRFQNIALWDTGTIVFDHLGWSSKTFRCAGIDMNPDGSMDVVFSEEQSGDWTDLDAADYNSLSTAALPAANATRPSEPLSFAVTPLSGAISGTLLPPIVRPFGTRYEVIAATNCADASVGTIAWSGDALNMNIPWTNADSMTWWWVRSYANSVYSGYNPSTYGLLAIPARAPDNTLLSRAVPDPDFRSGITVGSYWFAPAAPTDAGSLSRTGGINDGAGCMTIVGSTGIVSVILAPDHRSIPGNVRNAGEHPISPGQRVAWQLGFRRTTALAGSGGQAGFGFAMGIKKTVGAVDYSIGTFGGFIRCDTLTLNEWAYASSSFVVPNSGWDRLETNIAVGPASLSSGTIQIGRYDVIVDGV
jgi:hypothetical protein